MKIYSKLVLGSNFDVIEEISTEYAGPVVEAKGSDVKFGKPGYSEASQIVKNDLHDPLVAGIKQDILTNPFANQASQEYQLAQNSIRGGYGARGLAGSGIAVQGEQDALKDLLLKSEAQRAGQLTGVLATASSSPSFPSGTPNQGSGFLGLK